LKHVTLEVIKLNIEKELSLLFTYAAFISEAMLFSKHLMANRAIEVYSWLFETSF